MSEQKRKASKVTDYIAMTREERIIARLERARTRLMTLADNAPMRECFAAAVWVVGLARLAEKEGVQV